MHNFIEMFKLGLLGTLSLLLLPITLMGYVIAFSSKKRAWMTLGYWLKNK